MLSIKDKRKLINYFPKIELSYDTIIHKKVHCNYFVAIPFGKKFFFWFTTFKQHPICLKLEVDTYRKNKICDIQPVLCCFHPHLATNTVLYGTVVENKVFLIEEIFFYKNEKIPYYQKLDYLHKIFVNDLKQTSFHHNNYVIGLPPMSQNYNQLINSLTNVTYKIYSIIGYDKKNNKIMSNKYIQEHLKHQTLMVKAQVQNDIYFLFQYCKKTEQYHFFDIAYIPNFETSKMMNGLFRNIKENANLDALEESDEEEEFENTEEDRFVELEKEIIMECKFHNKFKKWVPIKKIFT